MKLEITGTLDIKPTELMLSERGMGTNRRVQMAIDSEVIRLMKPYTPHRNGVLERELNFSGVGTGMITQHGPYARYQYYGKVMVDPKTKAAGFLTPDGWRSRKGVKKVLTDRDLTYQDAPMRGAYWFERMKNDHKDDILRAAAAAAGGSAK